MYEDLGYFKLDMTELQRMRFLTICLKAGIVEAYINGFRQELISINDREIAANTI